MRKVECNFCGSERYEERRIGYLYSHEGNYLLVPNTPVEICLDCGMIYYEVAVLKEIERLFLPSSVKLSSQTAILRYQRKPMGDFSRMVGNCVNRRYVTPPHLGPLPHGERK